MTQGIHYLHSENIIHGDIKPENALIMGYPAEKARLVLSDFGEATGIPDNPKPLSGRKGSFGYLAP